MKSGCDGIGGVDHIYRVYISSPQEAYFIGPDRIRVKYDDLTQSQWTAEITAIAAEEKNLVFQWNMLTYLTSILHLFL